MKKQEFQYGISGYRWAPASFHVCKGLPGQKKTDIPLTDAERREVGRRFLTGGFHAAVAYVKHIEQEKKHGAAERLDLSWERFEEVKGKSDALGKGGGGT